MKKRTPDKSINSNPEPEMELLLLQEIKSDKPLKGKGVKMEKMINCPICQLPNVEKKQSSLKERTILNRYTCNNCSEYLINPNLLIYINDLIKNDENRIKISKFLNAYFNKYQIAVEIVLSGQELEKYQYTIEYMIDNPFKTEQS